MRRLIINLQRLRQDKTKEECSVICYQLRCQIGFIRGNRPKLKCFQDIMIEHADDFLNKGIGMKVIKIKLEYGCFPVWMYGENNELIINTVDNPYTIRASVNKATGNSGTVFYTQQG